MFSSCYHTDFKEKFLEALSQSPYTVNECRIIKSRYVTIVTSTEQKSFRTDFLFYLFTNVITVAGVLISSLISLEKAAFIDNPVVIFWLIWSFSLALILANKWLYTFNIHKKHVLNSTVMEKLYAEGWCFISGVGRYSLPTEHERFKRFISRVEKLKMKYIESLAGMEADGSADVSEFFSPRKSIDSEETARQRKRMPRDDTEEIVFTVPKKKFKLAKTMSTIIKPHKQTGQSKDVDVPSKDQKLTDVVIDIPVVDPATPDTSPHTPRRQPAINKVTDFVKDTTSTVILNNIDDIPGVPADDVERVVQQLTNVADVVQVNDVSN